MKNIYQPWSLRFQYFFWLYLHHDFFFVFDPAIRKKYFSLTQLDRESPVNSKDGSPLCTSCERKETKKPKIRGWHVQFMGRWCSLGPRWWFQIHGMFMYVLCSSLPGANDPIWLIIFCFSNGSKPPTSSFWNRWFWRYSPVCLKGRWTFHLKLQLQWNQDFEASKMSSDQLTVVFWCRG